MDIDQSMAQTLYQLIRERRSIRQYNGRPVERALIRRLLTAALTEPDADNHPYAHP